MGWSVPEREDWCGKEVGGSAAQEAGSRRKRGSEVAAARLGERSGDDSAARRAPGGSESGEEATARL